MNPDPGLTSAALLALLVLSAFLAAARTALLDASRTRLGELQKKGDGRATQVLALLQDEERTSDALSLAQIIVVLGAGSAALPIAAAFRTWPETLALAAALLIVFCFFGAILPRAFAEARAERVATALAPVIAAVTAVIGGPAAGLHGAARRMLRFVGLNGGHESHTMHEELREAIDLHAKEGTVVKNDRDMLSGILAMQDLEVSDIMVHRTKMTMIDLEADPEEI